jgi:bacteriocin-type transport-associated protein
MTEVLLRELSNADLDWLIETGEQQSVLMHTVLLQPSQESEQVYLLLNGALTMTATSVAGEPLAIARLTSGEMVGEAPLLVLTPLAVTVTAEQDSIVLAIPGQALHLKLQQDMTFAAHFNRAIALMLSERLRRMYEMPDQLRYAKGEAVKEALFVLGELRDSDIDWLTTAGQVQRYDPDDFLLQAGRPVDALHIILDGAFAVSVMDETYDPFNICFECPIQTASTMNVVATLGKGEMAGTVAFLDFRPLPVTIRAVDDSLVLSVLRQTVVTKLQQDNGFAARFYRVVAVQLTHTLQTVMRHLGCESQVYQQGMDLDDTKFDDELDLDTLQQMSHGAARFNWMLKQLGVGA